MTQNWSKEYLKDFIKRGIEALEILKKKPSSKIDR